MFIENWMRVPDENEISLSLRLLEFNAHQIVKQDRRQSIIFGGAGCGKTYTIDKALLAFRNNGLEPIVRRQNIWH